MKKKIYILCAFIIFIILIACNNKMIYNSKTIQVLEDRNSLTFFKNDTLAYLNNLVKNKVRYIGKPLSVFLEDLAYPIKSFTASPTLKKKESLTISLIADDYNTYRKIGTDRPYEHLEINIIWQAPVSMDSVTAIYNENGISLPDRYKWTSRAKSFFWKTNNCRSKLTILYE